MPDESPAGKESGGALREQLEASLARENATREALEKAYDLSPGALKGTEPAKFATRADELKVQQKADADALIAKRLGVPVEDVDAKLATLDPSVDDDKGDGPAETATDRIAGLGALGARPAQPDLDDESTLWGADLIAAEFRKHPPKRA